jgi:hypothetical protein
MIKKTKENKMLEYKLNTQQSITNRKKSATD